MVSIDKILENVNSVVVGKENIVKLILTAMLAEGHVLIEDVPGVGKTTFANAFAKTFDCSFSRIQFTPDTMPGDVIGSSIYNFESHEFEYVPGAIMGNIILADEINRTSPKTQASMLEAMEERRVTVDGKGHELPYPFVVIATQNPVMQRGTYYLPESQLDRFMMKLSVGYPDIRQSIQIVKNQIEGKTVKLMENVAGTEEWSELIKQAGEVAIKDELIAYAAECIECTRNHEKVQLGASPRALLSWIKAAKSYAYVCGRGYVIPDDLKALAYVVLCHRIILKQNTGNDDEEVRRIITEVLGKVKVPIG
ncbi:MAG: AAA family ATPase [Lachnospira sp.]|nr:MoxR family ATPase [Clostridia bacterium]